MAQVDPIFLSNRIPEIEGAIGSLEASERPELARGLEALISEARQPLLARVSAGNALGLLGDPRVDPMHPDMCPVASGPFWMGTDVSEAAAIARRFGLPEAWMLKSTPRHRVDVGAFEIAKHLVTEAEYLHFIADTGYWEIPEHWIDGRPPPYRANHPVHGVSWQSALLYAEWVSERTGLQYRIPTEAEWEKAARGDDGRAFPWGERFDASRCNTREGGVGGTTPVGIYPLGASPFGALDMAGNVEELVADLYGPYPGSRFEDGDYGSYRMTRGGVFCLDADLARCDRRHGTAFAGPTGFRLARSAADEWAGGAA